MALKMIFAPDKNLHSSYALYVSLELRQPYPGDRFDKMIEKGLSEQYSQIYGKKSVKLVGYDYVQYNKNGWSYYPVQLVVKSESQGVSWIKWRCENMEEYFEFNVLSEKNLERLPIEYRFCSGDENKKLSIEFPQPTFNYDICCSKNIIFTPNAVLLSISNTFNYEYMRQMTKLYSEITGIPDIHKYLFFSVFVVRYALDINGYTYAISQIYSKPHWDMDLDYEVIIRWKSNTEKEYIRPQEKINSGDVTFEFSPVIPQEFIDAIPTKFRHMYDESLHIAKKEDIINFIESNPHRKQPDPVFGTYFDVNVESMNYPDMSFILEFKRKLNDSQIQKSTLQISEFIEEYNSTSDDKIHNYDINAEGEKQINLIIDFGNTGEDAIKGLFAFLNTIKNIKQVRIL